VESINIQVTDIRLSCFVLPATQAIVSTTPQKLLVQFHPNFTVMINTMSCCASHQNIFGLMIFVRVLAL
jgi:hypothetical protein